MYGLLSLLNAVIVFINQRTVRVPGLDILPFAVLMVDSFVLAGLAVLLHFVADIRSAHRLWIMAVSAMAASIVGSVNIWTGFIVYYACSIILGYYSGLLGSRFASFIAVNCVLNGLLFMLWA